MVVANEKDRLQHLWCGTWAAAHSSAIGGREKGNRLGRKKWMLDTRLIQLSRIKGHLHVSPSSSKSSRGAWKWFLLLWLVSITWVQAYSNSDWHFWHVSHLKGPHRAQDIQGHVGNLSSMSTAIPLWEARGHHVGISNGLYLEIIKSRINRHVTSSYYFPHTQGFRSM